MSALVSESSLTSAAVTTPLRTSAERLELLAIARVPPVPMSRLRTFTAA